MTVLPVLTENVAQVWPEIEPHLEAALEFSKGDYNIEHAKVYCAMGHWQVYVGVEDDDRVIGAAAVEFANRPNDRVAFVVAIGGRLLTSQERFEQFCTLLKAKGATKIEGAARESAARLWQKFGFTEKYQIVEVSL